MNEMGLIERWTIDHFTVGTPKSAHQRGWNEGVEQVWRDEIEPLRQQLRGAVEALETVREMLLHEDEPTAIRWTIEEALRQAGTDPTTTRGQ